MTPKLFILRFGVQRFYHFTDRRNLPSIRANNGLLPLAELRRRKISVPAPGGNERSHDADARVGLDEYVHLCLLNEHPMEFRAREDGRIERSVFLEVNRAILDVKGVRFTPDVSNKAGVQLFSLEQAVAVMDFQVLYERTNWCDPEIKARRKIAKRYELLIPRDIPLKFIGGACYG